MSKASAAPEAQYTDPMAQSQVSAADLAGPAPARSAAGSNAAAMAAMSGGEPMQTPTGSNQDRLAALGSRKRPPRKKPAPRDMITSANGVQIPRAAQGAERLAHDFAYKDAELGPDGKPTGELRRCDTSDTDLSKCVSPEDEAWLQAQDYEARVIGDADTDFQAVGFTTGAQRQQSYPGMKAPHMAIRGTGETASDWGHNLADGDGISAQKYAANHGAMWSMVDQLAGDTGQRVDLSGHSQGYSDAAQLAADKGRQVGSVYGFQGAGAPKSAADRFTRQHGPGSKDHVPVWNIAAKTDQVDKVGHTLPGHNVVVSNDPSGKMGAPELGMYGQDTTVADEAIGLVGGVATGHTDKGLTQDWGNRVAKETDTHRSLREGHLEDLRGEMLQPVLSTVGEIYDAATNPADYINGVGEYHRMDDSQDVTANGVDTDLRDSAAAAPDASDLSGSTENGRTYVEPDASVMKRGDKAQAHTQAADTLDSGNVAGAQERRRYSEQGDAVIERAERKEAEEGWKNAPTGQPFEKTGKAARWLSQWF